MNHKPTKRHTMKKNIINMKPSRGTAERQEKAKPDSGQSTEGATIAPRPAWWPADMSLPDIRRNESERWLQDELDDARLELDERGARGLARLFSAPAVKALRTKTAMILLGFPPTRCSTPLLPPLSGCGGGGPHPFPKRDEGPHGHKPLPLLDNGSWPKC